MLYYNKRNVLLEHIGERIKSLLLKYFYFFMQSTSNVRFGELSKTQP